MARDYSDELKEAQVKLHNLLWALERMQADVAKQKRIVAALTELANVEEGSPAPTGLVSGVTDAVRTVFRAAEKPLSPADVRSRVEALGLPPQQNLLASVHTVIRRLIDSKEIEPFADVGYRWTRTTSLADLMTPVDHPFSFGESSPSNVIPVERDPVIDRLVKGVSSPTNRQEAPQRIKGRRKQT